MSPPTWRKGRLLVAAPNLVDPNFVRTVILVLEHSAEGALGVVLNRPTELRIHDALPDDLAAPLGGDDVVFQGGPVDPGSVILLGDFLEDDPDADGAISVGSIRVVEPESDFATLGERVRALRAFGGYAGWAAGQLEDEIAEEAWIDCACEIGDVFSDLPEELWGTVLDRQGGRLRLVARMPLDPGLN